MIRNKKFGFSLIELMLTIVLIGIFLISFIGTMRKKKRVNINDIVHNINDLLQKALTSALLTKKQHIIKLKINNGNLLEISYEQSNKDKSEDKDKSENKDKFENEKNKFIIRDAIKMQKLFINGKNELQGITKDAWFYIEPEGYSQEVELDLSLETIFDNKTYNDEIKLEINPFLCQFEYLD